MTTYSQQIKVIDESIKQASKSFRHVVPKNSDIKWGTEKVFALDIMRKNKDLRNAMPETLVSALLQAGSMGLSLNPSAGECFLIPRKMSRNDPNSPIIAYASPSYRGLIKTAVDSGAILYGVAEVVYQNDTFNYYGKTKPPEHIVDVKKERGKPIGAYALAELPSGAKIAEWIDKAEIEKIKKLSDNKNGLMWSTFWTQGWCKAVLRRAQKTWPRAKQLNAAIAVLNEHEGIDFDTPPATKSEDHGSKPDLLISEEQSLIIHAKITDNSLNMEIFMNWLSEYYRGIHSIDDLSSGDFQAVCEKIDSSIAAKAKAADNA